MFQNGQMIDLGEIFKPTLGQIFSGTKCDRYKAIILQIEPIRSSWV